jgi:hypothetical protein
MILEETLPEYQTALASLPEEPNPVTLPPLLGRFYQSEEMDAEQTADPPAVPPNTDAEQQEGDLTAAGTTPLADPPIAPQPPPTSAETRRTALSAFHATPRLRDPARIQLEDISILLHLLRDTPECTVSLSRITPCIPSTEAVEIWSSWATHLDHEGTPAPLGSTARDFFLKVLVSSPANAGEQAEVANLLRLYVTDTIKESTLRAHTFGAPGDEPMPQSSSKRGRDEAGDTEDTATYPGQTAAPVQEEPPQCRTPR